MYSDYDDKEVLDLGITKGMVMFFGRKLRACLFHLVLGLGVYSFLMFRPSE
jgi:hypothetical protein